MHSTFYRTTQVDGLSLFYREAGPRDAPTLLLLHGLPSSSRMFEPLFARLSDRYHLVAPDYPGCGHSDLIQQPTPIVDRTLGDRIPRCWRRGVWRISP
jgi:pimeloyl-ACP methyl ester carboxylesterase